MSGRSGARRSLQGHLLKVFSARKYVFSYISIPWYLLKFNNELTLKTQDTMFINCVFQLLISSVIIDKITRSYSVTNSENKRIRGVFLGLYFLLMVTRLYFLFSLTLIFLIR